MVTVKSDERRRVVLPGIEPGQVFACETVGGSIKLTPVKPVEDDVPLVKMVRDPKTGLMCFPPHVKISREQIRAAIRADRDRK